MAAKRSALIVATSEYKDVRLSRLPGPAEDAIALKSVLGNPEIGGFEVKVALNSRVETVRRTLEAFFTDRSRDDLLLVHFSGHGLKDDDGQLYLAAADTQLDRLLSTGIDATWINKLMDRSRSESIALFLDCCFAGAFTRGLTRRVAGDTAGVKETFRGSGVLVIAASDAMQYAFESGQRVGELPEPSPFTKALVDGLRTGEADRNEDGHVSINELFDFLEDRIHQTSPFQTPTKSAFNQVGDWSIARSARGAAALLLPESVRAQIKSDNPLDRFSALFDLKALIEGSDARVAAAARQAVVALADDDSMRVSTRAKELLEAKPIAVSPPTPPPPVQTTPKVLRQPSEPPPVPPGAGNGKSRELWGLPPDMHWEGGGAPKRSRLAVVVSLAALGLLIAALVAVPLMGGAFGRPTPSPSSSGGPSGAATPTRSPAARTTPLPAADQLIAPSEIDIDGNGNGAGGNQLLDETGRHRLYFTPDGDVVVETIGENVRWRAGVSGAARVIMQNDGALVIRDADNQRLWETARAGSGLFTLFLQPDGNLVVRRAGNPENQPIWASQSDGGCEFGCGECVFNCPTGWEWPANTYVPSRNASAAAASTGDAKTL